MQRYTNETFELMASRIEAAIKTNTAVTANDIESIIKNIINENVDMSEGVKDKLENKNQIKCLHINDDKHKNPNQKCNFIAKSNGYCGVHNPEKETKTLKKEDGEKTIKKERE